MNYFNSYTSSLHLRRPEVHPGGTCWVVFAKWEDVAQWPLVDPLTGICNTPFALKDGKTWYNCQMVDRNRQFEENVKSSAAGPYWETKVSGYMGGNNPNLTLAIAQMPFHQYVVMFRDRDGQIRFLGNYDGGADPVVNYTSGERDASRKISLSFLWEHVLPAPIYVGALTDIIEDILQPPINIGGDFNDDFSNDFN